MKSLLTFIAIGALSCATVVAQEKPSPSNFSSGFNGRPTQTFSSGDEKNYTGFNTRPQNNLSNPAAGPFLDKNAQLTFEGDFLYLYSNLSEFSPVRKDGVKLQNNQTNPSENIRVPLKGRDFNWRWDPGFRLRIGKIFNRDGWDLNGSWTYFYNSTRLTKAVDTQIDGTTANIQNAIPGTFRLSAPMVNPTTNRSVVKGRYNLLYHNWLLDVGRSFWVSHFLNVRPSIGIQGIASSIHYFGSAAERFLDNRNRFTVAVGSGRFKQRYWGVGLINGVEGNWHFLNHWSFLSKGALGLVYGRMAVKRTEFNDITRDGAQIQLWKATLFHGQMGAVPTFDLALGLRWNSHLYNNRYHLALSILWENHFLFDFNRFDRPLNESTESGNRQMDLQIYHSDGNLILSGISAGGTFEF